MYGTRFADRRWRDNRAAGRGCVNQLDDSHVPVEVQLFCNLLTSFVIEDRFQFANDSR